MAPNKISRTVQEQIPPLLQLYAAFHPWLDLTPWLDKCPSLPQSQPSYILSSLYTKLWVSAKGQSGKEGPRGRDNTGSALKDPHQNGSTVRRGIYVIQVFGSGCEDQENSVLQREP